MIVAISAYCFYANFLTYRILMAVIGLLTAVTGYLLIMRLCGRDTALLIGGLFAVNHILLQNSTYTTSDVPFALISLLALHATLSAAYSRRIIFWAVAAGLIMGLPPLFRVNGWGLPPAAAFSLFFVWKDRPSIKRLGCAAVFLFFSLIPTLAWEFYKSTFPASVNEGTYINALTGRSLDTQISIILKSAWDYAQESSYASHRPLNQDRSFRMDLSTAGYHWDGNSLAPRRASFSAHDDTTILWAFFSACRKPLFDTVDSGIVPIFSSGPDRIGRLCHPHGLRSNLEYFPEPVFFFWPH